MTKPQGEMKKTRERILNKVLQLNSQIEELQTEINDLYEEAKLIVDEDDDEHGRDSYLSCIESYTSY